jgi:cell division protein FtsW (lipid II flippase)
MTIQTVVARRTNQRGVELILVVCALLTAKFALFMIENATSYVVPVSMTVQLVVVGMALLGHLAIGVLARFADPFIYPIVLLLNLLGILMIHRLDINDFLQAQFAQAQANEEANSQLIFFFISIILMIATLFLIKDHRQLQRYTYTAMIAGFVLLLLPMLPVIGATVNGARLWIRVGGLSFQPAELAKIALPIFFAGYLARRRLSMQSIQKRWLGIGIPRWRDAGPIIIAWGFSLMILISQRDLGTSLLFFGLFVGMLYLATGQRTWLALGFGLFSAGAFIAYQLFSHVKLRTTVWIDPFSYAHDEAYQLVQGLYGFASGGIFGRGLGQGFSWLVPYAKSDFILSAFGEELGYVGLVSLVLLYALLVQRVIRTALLARDDFGQLLLTVTRLIPLTGLTTPFLAAGGSALIANWLMVALILRISHVTTRLNAPGDDMGDDD